MFLDLARRDDYKFEVKLPSNELYTINTVVTFEVIDMITGKAEKLGNATINSQTKNKDVDYIEIMNKHNKKIFETIVPQDVRDDLRSKLHEDTDLRIKMYNSIVRAYINGLELFISELEKEETEDTGK